MSTIDEQGRPEPPIAADETATLLGFLEYQRSTLRWKCGGLDGEQLSMTTAASTMTLGGLLKHLALVEDGWFCKSLHGDEHAEPWRHVDWESDPDWEWHSATADDVDTLWRYWFDAVERSREKVSAALARGGLEQLAERKWPDGTSPSLRWILCHMIEEYARHNGHADLLREVIDGETGE